MVEDSLLSSKQSSKLIDAVTGLLRIGIRNSMVPQILLKYVGNTRITEAFVTQVGVANDCSNPRKGPYPNRPIKNLRCRAQAGIFLYQFSIYKSANPDCEEWEIFVKAFEEYAYCHKNLSTYDYLNAEECWTLVKQFNNRTPSLSLLNCGSGHWTAIYRGELAQEVCPICARLHAMPPPVNGSQNRSEPLQFPNASGPISLVQCQMDFFRAS